MIYFINEFPPHVGGVLRW